jgi:hypothetical protein
MTTIGEELTRERLSAYGVVAITLVALLVGWGLKTSIETRTSLIERDNITAAIPDGWLVQDGTEDLIFTTRHPLSPRPRYSVSLVADGDRTLADVASDRNRSRDQILDSYAVLEETSIVRQDQEGYRVTFVYVASTTGGEPRIVKGVECSLVRQQYVLAISLESDAEDFDDALPGFERFLDSVSITEGG